MGTKIIRGRGSVYGNGSAPARAEHTPPVHPPISARRDRPGVWNAPLDADLKRRLHDAVASEIVAPPFVAVLVPVLSRPARVAPLIASFEASVTSGQAKLYFVAQASDHEEIAALHAAGQQPIVVGDVARSWARKINRGYERTNEPWMLLGADDLAFHPGWIDHVQDLLLSHHGVIGTNDLCNPGTADGTHATHPLVRRAYADVMGTVDERRKITHEGYDHNYPDTELVSTARRRGLFVHCRGCIVEHLHPIVGKAAMDEVYERGQKFFLQDAALFRRRARMFGLG